MSDKLLPCPFCGGEAELIRIYCHSTNWMGWKVVHNQCSVIKAPFQTPSFQNINHAIKAWNHRTNKGGTA